MKRLILLVAAFGLASCGNSEPQAPSRIGSAPIAADVFEPYDANTYPKTFSRWGAARMAGEVQALRVAAAEAVAQRPECDAVMLSEVSDRSSPPSAPEVFVDCENGNRWRYSGDQPPVSRPPDQLSVYGN